MKSVVQNIFIFEAQMCFLTWCQGCWFIGVGPFKTITVTLAVETVIRFKQNWVRCNICLLQEQSSHCNNVFTRPMCILNLKKILCKPASLVSVLALSALQDFLSQPIIILYRVPDNMSPILQMETIRDTKQIIWRTFLIFCVQEKPN